MKRRSFLAGSSAAALAGCAPSPAPVEPAPSHPVRMYVGAQRSPTNPYMLDYLKRSGVNNICGYPPRPPYPQRG